MKVTFPHFGPLYLAVAKLFDFLEVSIVIPPANREKALAIGASISPEEICLPFKYMAGNLAEAHVLGADTVVMMATGGPCRLGEYGELLKDMLDDAGCSYRWILIDNISSIGLKETFKRLEQITSECGSSRSKTVRGILMTIKLLNKMDNLRRKLEERAGYIEDPFDAVRLLHKTEKEIQKADSFKMCFRILKLAEKELAGFASKKNADPVKVLIAGEIYTSIEPEANGRLEEKLMTMGCSVKRHIDISWWMKRTLLNVVIPEKLHSLFQDGDVIKNNVGGYGRETVSKIIKDKWNDGIIKIMPAGCMPEIVTKAFCDSLQNKKDIRILNLIYDEMSGQAGYETRLEAFVDMLERRKDVLVGNRHRVHKHRYGIDG